jgi:CheY-like chemotaxis protein
MKVFGPAPTKRVLIIEDEPVLRENMIRGLAKLSEVEVIGAATVEEALQRVDQRAPDLVISDIDLPDRLGLEIIGEMKARGLAAPVVFVSAYLNAYQSQIPPEARVDVYEKPLSIEKLRAIVQEKLRAAPGPSSPFGVSEYLQLACLGRHSLVIEVVENQFMGRIIILKGEPWSAEDSYGKGLEAFWRLTSHRGENIACATLNGEPGFRNLEGSIDSLLLEAACRADEAKRHSGTDLSSCSAEPSFEELMDRALTLILQKRHDEALQLFEQARALRPEDRQVEANIQRLKGLMPPR